jgi:hypothetical protein
MNSALFQKISQNPLARVLMNAAGDAAVNAANKPSTPADARAVRETVPEIQEAMAQKIATTPELQHVTNLEPFYQKRSWWSMAISGVLVVAGPLILKYTGFTVGKDEVELTVTVMTAVGGIWAGYTAWRAGKATRPLFSGKTNTL